MLGCIQKEEISHPVLPPAREIGLQAAVVLEPERNRREIEHLGFGGKVCVGWNSLHQEPVKSSNTGLPNNVTRPRIP